MTTYHNLTVAPSTTIFYREAGVSSSPTVLLLHGFPSSSVQYRHLIPLLAEKYHVIAPDLPGYGFTTVPNDYKHTFDNLAITTSSLLIALKIDKFSMYIFDYGAPVGMRLATGGKFQIQGIVSQNGNCYDEGFGQEFWAPIFALWKSENGEAEREWLLTNFLTLEATKYQYTQGVSPLLLDKIAPETHTFDFEHIAQTPGNVEVQLDFFYDYRSNPPLYAGWQKWLRESKVPVLAVWGEGDPCFIPPGAKAFENDARNPEVHLLEGAGHFALETHLGEIAGLVVDFLGRKVDRE
ncbi:soluble epoxide hydrolase [Venturia nashicola]|uniref:Soluble epoxide hydrolase n=1 Tax=Venturia nashicola TaxID=86259 RepID=A0A4Z1P906_9PEZI|nr:soluble epoxide hydrolase [Venturia nashicola]